MIISHLPYGPTAYFNLSNCVMRHDIPDIGNMSEAFPHLIFHNFQSKLGNRVSCVCYVSREVLHESGLVRNYSCFYCSKVVTGDDCRRD